MLRCVCFCSVLIIFFLILSKVRTTSSGSNALQANNVEDKNYLGAYHGKIAFLFLTRGDLPHSNLWEIFFSWHAPPTHYSIYWHTSTTYHPPDHSFFADKQMKELVITRWGDTAAVTQHILKAALRDPENQYFVLLSEACIPVVSFPVWYRSVMAFKKYSIVNACDFTLKDMEGDTRWRPELNEVPGFRVEHWRKSAQWIAVNRDHAQVIADDNKLLPKFGRVFPSDEHYVPSVLALHGLDNQTTCSDGFTHVLWPNNAATHPFNYGPEEIVDYHPSPLLKPSSKANDNDEASAQYHKHETFISHVRNTNSLTGVFNGRCAYYSIPDQDKKVPLPSHAKTGSEEPPCHFAARKFPDNSFLQLITDSSKDIFRDDSFGLQITSSEVFPILHKRLRYNPEDKQVYFLHESNLLLIPDVQIMHYPAQDIHLLPDLKAEDIQRYHINDALKILQGPPFLYKLAHLRAVWWVENNTRSMIPDFDTFLAKGWDTSQIRNLNYDAVRFIPVAPMMPSVNDAKATSQKKRRLLPWQWDT